MQIDKQQLTPTNIKLTIIADRASMDKTKDKILKQLGKQMKLAGFRPGKAPLSIVERQADPSTLQNEFLNEVINDLYTEAANKEHLRPVGQPQVNVTKFVPFATLEFTAEVEVVGEAKLPDYKSIKLAKKPVAVVAKDIEDVIANLRTRSAEKEDVTRASKDGDQVWIDFSGLDAKSKLPINGADGKDYPLILGSDSFIPGFEAELVGLKSGDEKTFTITFPKDYSVGALAGRQAEFTVTVNKVQKLVEPKLDDEFAAQVGPFKTLKELKDDIKKQLEIEKQNQANREYENELIDKISEGSTVAIPASLVDEEIERAEQQERQNLNYRGQTWQEHLVEEGVTEEQHRERLRETAERRVKGGLVLSEIATLEGITVTKEELDAYLQSLKAQYPDPQMQAELDKPEGRREMLSRIVSEKTINKLVEYAS